MFTRYKTLCKYSECLPQKTNKSDVFVLIKEQTPLLGGV